MLFDDIASDTRWTPGPAARYNELNRLLRAGEAAAPSRPTPHRHFAVDVRNDADDTIRAYHAVKLGGPVSRPADALPGWSVTPAVDPRAPWAVATGDVAPGCWGRAIVQVLKQKKVVHFDLIPNAIPTPTNTTGETLRLFFISQPILRTSPFLSDNNR